MIRDLIKTSPYTYIAGFVILLVSHGFVYFTGKEHGLERYYDLKSSVEKESELLRLDNERKLQALSEVNRQVADDYAKARAALAAGHRVVRVRESCSGTGILPTAAAPAQGLDAAAEARTITAEQCEAYLNDGLQDAQQLMWLQDWAIKTHEVSE